MTLIEHKVEVETTGASGSATGVGYTPAVHGRVLTVTGVPASGIPTTTDITVSEDGGANRVVLTLTDLASDTPFTYNPREALHDTSGGDLTYDSTEPLVAPIALGGRRIKIAIEDCDAFANALTVYIVVEV